LQNNFVFRFLLDVTGSTTGKVYVEEAKEFNEEAF